MLLGAFLSIDLCILDRSLAFSSFLSAVLPNSTSSHSPRVVRNLKLIRSNQQHNESYLPSDAITRIGSSAGKTETSRLQTFPAWPSSFPVAGIKMMKENGTSDRQTGIENWNRFVFRQNIQIGVTCTSRARNSCTCVRRTRISTLQ